MRNLLKSLQSISGLALALVMLLAPAAAFAEEPKTAPAAGDEAAMINLCNEVAASVEANRGDCDGMATALRGVLNREREAIRGKITKGVRKRYPKAVAHCEAMVKDTERVAPLLACLPQSPSLMKTVNEATDIARGKK